MSKTGELWLQKFSLQQNLKPFYMMHQSNNYMNNILSKTATYIQNLFEKELPLLMVFHNIEHTLNVIKAVEEICEHTLISLEDKEIVLLAAWFHDSGLTLAYKEHKLSSQAIARHFLKNEGVEAGIIKKVLACIEASTMPQNPQTLLEKILCDADLWHLSSSDYFDYEYLLRTEWDLILNKTYTQKEWLHLNIDFFTKHVYFTDYGKAVWKKRKHINMEILTTQLKKTLSLAA